MSNTSPMVRNVSMVPAMYIHVAGGLNLAALKNPKVAGSVNLPTMCGMKNSAQIRRRSTIGLRRLNLSAHDMLFPRGGYLRFISMDRAGWRKALPADLLATVEPVRAQRIERVGARPVDPRHIVLHLVADLGLQIGEVAVADREARQQLRVELRRLRRVDRSDLVLLVSET